MLNLLKLLPGKRFKLSSFEFNVPCSMFNDSKNSFTLIELLVVIAIIGTLSALLLPNFMGVRQRARDSTRKSDVKNLQKAFELYKLDQATPAYPIASPVVANCWASTGSSSICPTGTTIYMNKVPADPQSAVPTPYFYSRSSQLEYSLCACLENTADSDAQACTSYCSGITCSTNKCFVVNQP